MNGFLAYYFAGFSYRNWNFLVHITASSDLTLDSNKSWLRKTGTHIASPKGESKSWCLQYKIGTFPWRWKSSSPDIVKAIEFSLFCYNFSSSFTSWILHWREQIIHLGKNRHKEDDHSQRSKKTKPFFFPAISQIFHARLPNSNPSNCEKRMAAFSFFFTTTSGRKRLQANYMASSNTAAKLCQSLT